MIEIMTFDMFKTRELKGDAIAKLMAIEIVGYADSASDRFRKNGHVGIITSNKLFAVMAKRLGVKPHPEDILNYQRDNDKREVKPHANAFEELICQIYEQHGYSETLKFFKQQISLNQFKIARLTILLSETGKL